MRPCPGRCGNLVESGLCPACVAGKPARKSAAKRGYGTQWRKEREAFFAARPFCADPFQVHGEILVLATDLDHIEPHKGNLVKFRDPNNRQGLCKACHSRKTALEDGGFGR